MITREDLPYDAMGDGSAFPTRRWVNLLTCYQTGQMTEKQWQEHQKEEPGLKRWLDQQR